MFIRSTRPIAAGEELCIVYTSVEASFAERTKTFQHWIRPHEGFECACELCQLLRSDSKLKKMEALVCKAFKEAGAQVALMGIPMAKAADRVMSLEKRDEVLRAYAKVPLRLQYPTVSNVEIMNGTCKSVQGDKQGALACYERAAAIGYAARGGTTCRHAKDLWRIVGASMACGKMQQAMETLASIWHGTYWEGIPLHEIRPAFTALTLRYTLPWWDDRQNASLQQQMLAMVAEICTTERRKPSSASQGGKAQKARTTKIKGKRRGKK